MILETNARPGMAIQIANKSPLKTRLDKVEDLKIPNPTRGIEIGKQLFGSMLIEEQVEKITGKQVIGNTESITLWTDTQEEIRMIAKIKTTKEMSIIDRALAIDLGFLDAEDTTKKSIQLKFKMGESKIHAIMRIKDLSKKEEKIMIGKKQLNGFLVDPSKQLDDKIQEKKIIKKLNFKKIDAELAKVNSELNITPYVNPLNAAEERETFFSHLENGIEYNPYFQYKKFPGDFDTLRKQVRNIETDDSPLGILFHKKQQELLRKIKLIEQRGDGIEYSKASINMFGKPSLKDIENAQALLDTRPDTYNEDPAKYHSEEIYKKFQDAITEYGIK